MGVGTGEPGASLLGEGWWTEQTFSWSGRRAEMLVPLPKGSGKSPSQVEITLDFDVYRAKGSEQKHVTISVDGQLTKDLAIPPGSGSPEEHQVVTLIASGQRYSLLEYRTMPAESPADQGSPDTRVLGVALKSMAVRRLP